MNIHISSHGGDIAKITAFLNFNGVYPENAKTTEDLYKEYCLEISEGNLDWMEWIWWDYEDRMDFIRWVYKRIKGKK